MQVNPTAPCAARLRAAHPPPLAPQLLKGLAASNTLPLAAGLRCVQTAFAVLQGPGRELQTDDKEFVVYLYKVCPIACASARAAPPAADPASSPHAAAADPAAGHANAQRARAAQQQHAHAAGHRLRGGAPPRAPNAAPPLMLSRASQAMFLRRRELVVDRIASFAKRLLAVHLHLPPHMALAVLSCVRCACCACRACASAAAHAAPRPLCAVPAALLHRYPRAQVLLEGEGDRVMTGAFVYAPARPAPLPPLPPLTTCVPPRSLEMDDPDLCNATSATAWCATTAIATATTAVATITANVTGRRCTWLRRHLAH